MNKKEMVQEIKKLYPEYTLYEIDIIITAFINTMKKELLNDRECKIRDFGTFKIKATNKEKVYVPMQKKLVDIYKKKDVDFITAKYFLNDLQGNNHEQ